MERLVIVSNRVPSLSLETSAGGLAVALKASLEESGGLWFGWSGTITERPGPQPRLDQCGAFSLATLDLSDEEFHGYYEEFSNRTLWPVFHGRLDLLRPDRKAYQIYRKVSFRFAHALSSLLQTGDAIWIQDYHLVPLGKELRSLGKMAPLGFFLHVPFPQAETFAALPYHRELLSDFCAYDLVGFQTSACAENFREAALRYLGGSLRNDGDIAFGTHSVRVGVFPVGIDTKAFREMAGSSDVQRRTQRLRACMHERDWICGVDRLDYTKGLAERFRAFEMVLDETPALQENISLIQIAAPSRESVLEYRDMRSQLESLSGRINGRLGTFDWAPIRYLNKAFNQAQLAALYRVSRIGLVTPLRDGMNLVAKEYVAAQDPEDPGVLILSRFAGAAQELTNALLVNPFDTSAVAAAIREALRMPLMDRQMRWRQMMNHLETNDVHAWRREFLKALKATSNRARDDSSPRAA
ncbi:trehalose-6-phosphate synthase [Pelagibius litoralis]|uniref:Trehalose-6-phosphate synthase n=1 Tax=Pelagibius litoralis TaxID=374515 RepID=A0A967KC41_9PROT|nr:trehalose-6-phosphate synthase [Pelagibius litoralis]NIA71457.1 trehalose-6-phosphate synthase [Pelagibius litoralis]